jgi:peptidoglycan/xylan/chitin deacetylase (PgdA/CDA1 family)
VVLASASASLPFAITVDDGGVSYYTLMADRLDALGWRGHCFVSTDFIGQRGFLTASQIRELDARGHLIGSHTASHPFRFSSRPVEEMRQEWLRSRQVLEDLLGHAVVTASVPGGYFSQDVARTAAASGLRTLFTSEPVTAVEEADGCVLVGRFTLRHGSAADASAKFVRSAPWTRYGAWTSWNAKGLVKPLLGNSYVRVADWVSARKAIDH